MRNAEKKKGEAGLKCKHNIQTKASKKTDLDTEWTHALRS